MKPHKEDPIVANADITESSMIERIRGGELINWIYNNATSRIDSLEFMRTICRVLNDLQFKGVISGFRASYTTGGNALPVLGGIILTNQQASLT